ncbi:MAG: TorA maturation chaperone TorD [Gammaproteobacteria bacterium]|jgi:TorA maturation chaperone TorD
MHDQEGIAANARLFEVAARLLVVELDADALDALLHPEIAQLFEEIAPGFTTEVKDLRDQPESMELLEAEFCKLFLMSKATSPQASVWAGGEQLAKAAAIAAQVDHWQSVLDVELVDGPWGNVPKDHFAVILGLYSMALLAEPSGKLAQEIHDAVLGDCLPRFCAAVSEHTTSQIYRGVVGLLEQLLEDQVREA